METTNKELTAKKRITIFVPEFPVLTETFIERDISKLIELGTLDIKVLTIKTGSGTLSDNIQPNVITGRLTFFDSIFAACYLLFKPKRVYKAFNLVLRDKTKSVIQRKYLFLKSLGYTYVFHKLHPDEIHVHFLSDPSTIAMVAAVILDIPFSINAHARDVTEYPTLVTEKLKLSKFITVCNTNAYNHLIKISGNYNQKVHLIRHGISAAKIFSTKLTLTKPTRFTIISGGTRLVEKKGLKYLILASDILKKRGIEHEVHITGPGPLYLELIDLIKQCKLENNVFIHGDGKGVPFSLVSQYYRIADVLVLPSIVLGSGDADGIPNALIEASLAKLSIISTDAGSISELITTGENGVLVPQKNSEALATEIEKLIFDDNRRTVLGENAFKKASDLFDIDKNVSLLASYLSR